jgi:Ricin-type beta-trefoil lectin domain-like
VSVLGLAGSALGLAAAAPAGAATSRPPVPAAGSTDPFEVVNYHSGMCLGITGGEDDAPAVQWPCNGAANQAWHWGSEDGSTGHYQLINGDGECLGVAGASTKEGADVVGWTCLGTGHPDQYWQGNSTLLVCGGDYLPYFDLHSGQVLGVAGNSTSKGASVVQWPYQGECNNQFWHLES